MKRVYQFDKEKTAGIIRGLRATARLTQKELAEKAHVSEASIKCYENGENVMSLEAAVGIATALGVTPSDLVSTVEAD